MMQIINAARELIKANKNIEALNLIDESVPQGHGDILLLRLQSFAYYNVGRYQESINTLKKALTLAPEDVDLYVDMSACYGALNDKNMANEMVHMASSYADKAVALNKSSAHLRLIQAQLCLKLNHDVAGKKNELAEARRLINIITDVQKSIIPFLIKDDIQAVFTYALEYERYKDLEDKEYWRDYWIHCHSVIPLMYQMNKVQTIQDRLYLLETHRLWGERISQGVKPVKRIDNVQSNKIKVGIITDVFEDSHVGRFITPLIKHWDKGRLELYCYEITSFREKGELYHAAKNKADGFREGSADPSSPEIAKSIADDGLDVLIDIGSVFRMPEIIAYKPAPIQMSWLDYPHSNGLPVDYIITDPYINPGKNLLLEKQLVLPKTWMVIDEEIFPKTEIINPMPEDRNGYITFGTMNSSFKITPEALKAWAELMLATPDSRFIYCRPETSMGVVCDNFIKNMLFHGVESNRISFVSTRDMHMSEYNNIDIALDTFPRTGGTTTCEALWMGVPVVSLVGPAFFERLSYSNLSNVGLGDLCGFNVEEYKDIALQLVADKQRRRYLRCNLRQQLLQSSLGQVESFVKDFTDSIANVLEA